MILKKDNDEDGVGICVEFTYHLDAVFFINVLNNKKKEVMEPLTKLNTDISVIAKKIKAVLDEFPTIKFDTVNCCFYNEEAEMQEFAARSHDPHSKSKPKSKTEETEHHNVCANCCTIF